MIMKIAFLFERSARTGTPALRVAGKTVTSFAGRLQDAVDLDSVRDDLTGVVHQALEPAHLSVWVSRPEWHRRTPYG
jgi:hypothetical protein